MASRERNPERTEQAAAPPQAGATAAWSNGLSAEGARWLVRGFSFREEWDLQFALGYPYAIELGGPTPAALPRDGTVVHCWEGRYHYGPEGGVWPIDVAAAMARVTVAGFRRTPFGFIELSPQAASAASKAGPVDRVEAQTLVEQFFAEPKYRYSVVELFLVLEAFAGPDAIVEAAVDCLVRLSRREANDERDDRKGVMLPLGHILERSSAPLATRSRARLEEAFRSWGGDDFVKRPAGSSESIFFALDRVLHGRRGAERSGERVDKVVDQDDLRFVHDDPEWLAGVLARSAKAGTRWPPMVRHAFLGGEGALDVLCETWRKLKKKEDFTTTVEQFARVRSPLVVAMMAEFAAARAVVGAREWLRRHNDYAEEQLAALAARPGVPGKRSAALLKALKAMTGQETGTERARRAGRPGG